MKSAAPLDDIPSSVLNLAQRLILVKALRPDRFLEQGKILSFKALYDYDYSRHFLFSAAWINIG